MRKGKYRWQESPKVGMHRMKPLTLVLALVLVVGTVAGGTVAWLIADTEHVVNTFTYGDINLKLDETEVDGKGTPVDKDGDGSTDRTTKGNEYEMVPGKEYLKDPAVTVLAGNEACWLFVKLEEKGGVTITNGDGSTTTYDFGDYLIYAVADNWTQLLDAEGNAVKGIYFCQVDEDTDDTGIVYEVLKDNKISVPDTVSKDMLNALDGNGENADTAAYPSLSVTAYAVQYSGFEAEVSEGADTPTQEQTNAAAWKAWKVVEAKNSTNP